MPYTVNQLATLAGISVRTLHHYDQVGLLRPASIRNNGYREYGETELLKLQQILFFRELEFSLDEIKRIMSMPNFDMRRALMEHREMIEQKKKRMGGLLKTIDKTIKRLNNEIIMEDKELFGDFDHEQYAEEAKQRWGNTDAYKQSQERYAKMSKADIEKLKKDADAFMKVVAATADQGATSPAMQELIGQHYESLRTWYEPNLEMYRGLATMYVDDPRFTAYYEKYKQGLAVVMRDAMLHYADVQEGKS